MSIRPSSPGNINNLQPNKFSFVIADNEALTYKMQSLSLPSVSTTAILQPTPLSEIKRHGDKLIYHPYTIEFIVDEDLRVWEETYTWLSGYTFPTSFKQYQDVKKAGIYKDATLIVNTNSQNENFRIRFKNCFPVALGEIRFNTTDSSGSYICDVTFEYDTFSLERS